MRILIEPSTLRQSKMGSITAVIYLELGPTQHFPDAGWNDFVVVVLNGWINALDQLSSGELTADLRFMDGPFWLTASNHQGSLRLRCFDGRSNPVVRFEETIGLEQMLRQVLLVASQVSKACLAANINSADVVELRTRLPN